MPSPDRFRETLDEFAVKKDLIDEIYCGFEEINSKTSKKLKAAFFTQALDLMNRNLPSESVREILEANACCKSGVRLKNSKEFAKAHAELSVPEKLELISGRPGLNMGCAELDENGDLIVHAVSYRLGEKFECACPTINKIKRDTPIPREYCYCCGGHFRFHYEIMLGARLKLAEILSSPHDTDGEKPCAFRFEFVCAEQA